jgi:hypothetical protein
LYLDQAVVRQHPSAHAAAVDDRQLDAYAFDPANAFGRVSAQGLHDGRTRCIAGVHRSRHRLSTFTRQVKLSAIGAIELASELDQLEDAFGGLVAEDLYRGQVGMSRRNPDRVLGM